MEETIIVSNSLGDVTTKRVAFNFKEGREDIPLSQITSISYEKRSNRVMAIACFGAALLILFGAVQMKEVPGSMVLLVVILFILFILIGIAHYIGNYYIRISVSGVDRQLMKVEMSKAREGRAIADAIRAQIMK